MEKVKTQDKEPGCEEQSEEVSISKYLEKSTDILTQKEYQDPNNNANQDSLLESQPFTESAIQTFADPNLNSNPYNNESLLLDTSLAQSEPPIKRVSKRLLTDADLPSNSPYLVSPTSAKNRIEEDSTGNVSDLKLKKDHSSNSNSTSRKRGWVMPRKKKLDKHLLQRAISPASDRMSAQAKQDAKQKTKNKKRLLKMKRQYENNLQSVIQNSVDSQTVLLVYQTYYERMMHQASKRICTRLFKDQITSLVVEVADQLLTDMRQKSVGRLAAPAISDYEDSQISLIESATHTRNQSLVSSELSPERLLELSQVSIRPSPEVSPTRMVTTSIGHSKEPSPYHSREPSGDQQLSRSRPRSGLASLECSKEVLPLKVVSHRLTSLAESYESEDPTENSDLFFELQEQLIADSHTVFDQLVVNEVKQVVGWVYLEEKERQDMAEEVVEEMIDTESLLLGSLTVSRKWSSRVADTLIQELIGKLVQEVVSSEKARVREEEQLEMQRLIQLEQLRIQKEEEERLQKEEQERLRIEAELREQERIKQAELQRQADLLRIQELERQEVERVKQEQLYQEELQRKKERDQEQLAEEATQKLLDLIIGSTLSLNQDQTPERDLTSPRHANQTLTDELIKEEMQTQMTDNLTETAIDRVQSTIAGELINQCIEKQLLVEAAFESVLKGLVSGQKLPSEKRRSTKKEQPLSPLSHQNIPSEGSADENPTKLMRSQTREFDTESQSRVNQILVSPQKKLQSSSVVSQHAQSSIQISKQNSDLTGLGKQEENKSALKTEPFNPSSYEGDSSYINIEVTVNSQQRSKPSKTEAKSPQPERYGTPIGIKKTSARKMHYYARQSAGNIFEPKPLMVNEVDKLDLFSDALPKDKRMSKSNSYVDLSNKEETSAHQPLSKQIFDKVIASDKTIKDKLYSPVKAGKDFYIKNSPKKTKSKRSPVNRHSSVATSTQSAQVPDAISTKAVKQTVKTRKRIISQNSDNPKKTNVQALPPTQKVRTRPQFLSPGKVSSLANQLQVDSTLSKPKKSFQSETVSAKKKVKKKVISERKQSATGLGASSLKKKSSGTHRVQKQRTFDLDTRNLPSFTPSSSIPDLIFDSFLTKQVRKIVAQSCQHIYKDHFYKRTLKRTVRKMLFEVIQESVDIAYYLEEDTITAANYVLDSYMAQQIIQIFTDESIRQEQIVELSQNVLDSVLRFEIRKIAVSEITNAQLQKQADIQYLSKLKQQSEEYKTVQDQAFDKLGIGFLAHSHDAMKIKPGSMKQKQISGEKDTSSFMAIENEYNLKLPLSSKQKKPFSSKSAYSNHLKKKAEKDWSNATDSDSDEDISIGRRFQDFKQVTESATSPGTKMSQSSAYKKPLSHQSSSTISRQNSIAHSQMTQMSIGNKNYSGNHKLYTQSKPKQSKLLNILVGQKPEDNKIKKFLEIPANVQLRRPKPDPSQPQPLPYYKESEENCEVVSDEETGNNLNSVKQTLLTQTFSILDKHWTKH